MILCKFVKQGRIRRHGREQVRYCTWCGTEFEAKRKATLDISFPELSDTRKVHFDFSVDDVHSPEDSRYDIIIGLDLIARLGWGFCFKNFSITWDDITIPMRRNPTIVGDDDNVDKGVLGLFLLNDSPLLKEAEDRQKRILDADYSKVDIDAYVDEQDNLPPEYKKMLASTLKNYPTLFGGGLGKLDIEPVHLELKPGAVHKKSSTLSNPKSIQGYYVAGNSPILQYRSFERSRWFRIVKSLVYST